MPATCSRVTNCYTPPPGSAARRHARGPTFGADLARRVVLRANGTSGYVLDAWGALHPFGGAPTVTGTPSWPFSDVERGVALRPDGKSGWVLDAFGRPASVQWHAYGNRCPVLGGLGTSPAPWSRPATASVGTYSTAGGALHAFGGTPATTDLPGTPGSDRWRSVVLGYDHRSGYVVDQFGGIRAFGARRHHSRHALAGSDDARGVGGYPQRRGQRHGGGSDWDGSRRSTGTPRRGRSLRSARTVSTATRSTPSASCAPSVGGA